jgi:signal transduction histidine kinase
MRTRTEIEKEIEEQFGFLPSFFAPAKSAPQVLESLWQQTKIAYFNNPLPNLYKEKLFVYLSRNCSIPYFLICHSCALHALGIRGNKIYELLLMPAPETESDLEEDFGYLTLTDVPLSSWATSEDLEQSLLRCAVLLFHHPQKAARCRAKLRQFLGSLTYSHLINFLGYIGFCHQWLENNPEISYEDDRRAQLYLGSLILEEVKLAEFFDNYYDRKEPSAEESSAASDGGKEWSSAEKIEESKQRLFDFLLNAPFPVMIHGSDGAIFHLNKTWTEQTGYTLEDTPNLAEWNRKARIEQQAIVQTARLEGDTVAGTPPPEITTEEPSPLLKTTRSELTMTTRTGEERIWELYSSPLARLADGKELSMAIALDLTGHLQAETALWESQTLLDLVLETADTGVWEWSLQSNRIIFSETAEMLFGLEKGSFRGNYRDFLQLIHPQERDAVDRALDLAVKERGILDIEYRVASSNLQQNAARDGYSSLSVPPSDAHRWRWLKTRGKVVFDTAGNPQRLVAVVVETNRDRLSPSLPQGETGDLRWQKLEVLLNSLPYHVCVVEKDGMRLSFCNEVFAASMGYANPRELYGKTLVDCLNRDLADSISRQSSQVFESGETLTQQETILLADGRHHFDTLRIPLRAADGSIDALVSISRDITDSMEIKDILSTKTIELETVNQELEAFSYSVSHDLYSPLRAIDGFSEVLLERYSTGLQEKAIYYLQRIRANSQRMGETVDELVKLSQVARLPLQIATVNLSAIAAEIATELNTKDSERLAEISIAPNAIVRGDPRLLRIVLDNLLGNAWKFSAKKDFTRVEFGYIHQPNGRVTYFVKDSGAGFDMTYADKLFIAFQRLHSQAEFSGTGIGLAVVKRIIQKHGGRIWAEASPDAGATFYFTLDTFRSSASTM